MTSDEVKAYYQGKREGIRLYAFWRNGTQEVGTTGRSLSAAIAEIDAEEKKQLELQEMMR